MSDTLQLVVDSPDAQHIEMGQRAVSVLLNVGNVERQAEAYRTFVERFLC